MEPIHENTLTKEELKKVTQTGKYQGQNIFVYNGKEYFVDLDKRLRDLGGE